MSYKVSSELSSDPLQDNLARPLAFLPLPRPLSLDACPG